MAGRWINARRRDRAPKPRARFPMQKPDPAEQSPWQPGADSRLSSKVEIFCGILSSVIDEVFWTKTGDVVPFAIRYRDVELYQYNVYAQFHWIVLGRGMRPVVPAEKRHENMLQQPRVFF